MSLSPVWSKLKCQNWLTAERVNKGIKQADFWHRISEWHVRQYEEAGNPGKLDWADKCLEVMMEVEKEMGLSNGCADFYAAQSTFKAEKVYVPAEEPKKRSVFSKLKESK